VKLDPKTVLAPVIAVVVLAVVLNQTLGALKSSGSWRTKSRGVRVNAGDPFARLDRLVGQRLAEGADAPVVRNPVRFGATTAPVAVHPAGPRRPVPPPAPARPILTAIIWDNDPRATISFNGRDFSVRENSRFADFKVRSITNEQVVLERNGEPLVLTLRSKGE
jgi:hypothetical protein